MTMPQMSILSDISERHSVQVYSIIRVDISHIISFIKHT